MARPTISSVAPLRAVEGGRVTLRGHGFPVDKLPDITVGDQPARVLFASSARIIIALPSELEGGARPIRIEDVVGETIYVSVGGPWATGLHQVDNPVFDLEGNLYVTYSGSRGQEAPVSIFRVTRAGTREPYVSGIVNPTSMAIGPDGRLYVSSRFEGAVYGVNPDGTHERIASDLGVACGLAFDPDGTLYVGDRSGTIFRVKNGTAEPFATLPASVAAFHLAISPTGERCSLLLAARRVWPSPRTKASCTSSTRWPAAADCTGCPISTASRSWWRRGAVLSVSPSVLTASWQWRRTRPPTASTDPSTSAGRS